MKNTTYLSEYQKQQYTLYLQSQLENFSSFMLKQSKQNENYKFCNQTLLDHKLKIQDIQQKINMIFTTQKRLADHSQGFSPHFGSTNFQNRLQRVQKNIQQLLSKKYIQTEIQTAISRIQSNVNQTVDRLEEQISSKRNLMFKIRNSIEQLTPLSQQRLEDYRPTKQSIFATKKDLQLLQEQTKDYLKLKINKIYKIITHLKQHQFKMCEAFQKIQNQACSQNFSHLINHTNLSVSKQPKLKKKQKISKKKNKCKNEQSLARQSKSRQKSRSRSKSQVSDTKSINKSCSRLKSSSYNPKQANKSIKTKKKQVQIQTKMHKIR